MASGKCVPGEESVFNCQSTSGSWDIAREFFVVRRQGKAHEDLKRTAEEKSPAG